MLPIPYIHTRRNTAPYRAVMLVLFLVSLFGVQPMHAEIRIGGDVYGGGNEGAVTGDSASVIVYDGNVRTVFGGGRQGEVTTGSTHVQIEGGTIGDQALKGTLHGGVFGAGDGAGAVVGGHSTVIIKGGSIINNVYGGGNEANLTGQAMVTLRGGFIHGDLYGGARMANIGGYTYVNIDGVNQTDTLVVHSIYGGNDIAGVIGKDANLPFTPKVSEVKADWNTFIRATHNTMKPMIVGTLYGGGNGKYNYVRDPDNEGKLQLVLLDSYDVNGDPVPKYVTLDNKPELAKTYIEMEGGIYGHVFGGGNMATVTENTVIYSDNATAIDGILNHLCPTHADIIDLDATHYRKAADGDIIFDYHATCLFGGNNLEPMAIRPTWYLRKGDINNLYSGGNRGAMTNPNGLILPLRSDSIRVNNVYGGCRIADVNPGAAPASEEISTYDFDKKQLLPYTFAGGYATRVYITGGRINNVYGGNDISGKVFHGTNVEVHGAISGDIYGGGNGSYAYTDNPKWSDAHPEDEDFYYAPGANSLEALYNFRPHVESTLVHITGDEEHPEDTVIVSGNVFCGGNSATLAAEDGNRDNAKAVFKVGKYAIIDGVFLGSNGENMVTSEILAKYASTDTLGNKFSTIDLAEETGKNIEDYMEGVAVNIKPELQWDDDIAQTTHIGSIYFGGNKGSMSYKGMNTINLPRDLVVYEKVVGGCNDALISKGPHNAEYLGGLLEPGEDAQQRINRENNALVETVDMENVKVWLNVNSYLKPMKLVVEHDPSGRFVDSWSYEWDMTDSLRYETFDNHTEVGKTFVDANVYGGCFNSGQVNGGTVIQVTQPLIHPDVYAEHPEALRATGEHVYGSAMAIYGAGFGAQSIIKGDTHVFLADSARVLLAFGGGEQGVVEGNTMVVMDKNMELPLFTVDGVEQDSINVYKVYGAGYAGPVKGNSTLHLYGGGLMRGFAGACNADVEGVSSAYVGWRDEEHDIYGYGRPYVKNAVFGGSDFGGQVKGDSLRTIQIDSIRTQQVRSQSYVQYVSGNIGKAIYGGSYGSYDYSDRKMYYDFMFPPTFMEKITADNADVIAANTFVDVASLSLNYRDIIGSSTRDALAVNPDTLVVSGIIGGGRGYRNQPGYVSVNQTYVLMHATAHAKRNPLLAYRVYGGGNLSTVDSTRIDLYSGNVENVFGGTHGVKTVTTDDSVAYNVKKTEINIYNGMDYALANVFGAGANSGTDKAYVNLYGGQVNDVHGGAYTEGYTLETYVNVPKGSTAKVNAIYGGGFGEEEGRPCDVGISNITYASGDASVSLGVFGGNHNARATSEAVIKVSSPLVYKFKDQLGNPREEYRSVYGGGYGTATVSGFTLIDLLEGAHVGKAYGGGKEGKVYNHYNYYGYTGDTAVDYAINDYYDNAPHRYANWVNDTIQPRATKMPYKLIDEENTHILINRGAVVEENVYGGGEGTTAYLSGESHVCLLGGLVKGDIYGGGDAGAMPRMKAGMPGFMEREEDRQTIATYCEILGGQARKVFGGGLDGDVEGDTYILVGDEDSTSFYTGVPAIQRNVYGGSERAVVNGKATVDMYNGYIGYEYMGLNKGSHPIGDYSPVLDLDTDLAVREFEDEGNLYGAGYGEGAVVMNTFVNLYGGTVRNSVYGGGEIAAVGMGKVSANRDSAMISRPGTTAVRIYGGLVEGDVFGGGRGYTYTYTYTGEDSPYKTSREYTDGYVFGHCDVEIYRGTIGTEESVAKGQGNVFGGGNIGYVYSPGVKYKGETIGDKIQGHYYYAADDSTTSVDERHERTEDCRVHITARCRALAEVTVGDSTYQKGQYVLNEDLNTLKYGDTEIWAKLDSMGITIRNAVFAGGNVTSGTDLVYANAVTVYGNATAAVIDVFAKDFVRLGGDHVGGLYGDGNLTFVDGYRELNITNYGTDYYNLSQKLTYDEYLTLSDLEKDYYSLIYELKEDEEVIFDYDGVKYSYLHAGDEIDDFAYRMMVNAWLALYREEMVANWTLSGNEYIATKKIEFTSVDGKPYTYYTNTHITAAQYEAMMDAYVASKRQEMTDKWSIKGMCAITAGRMMNTVQRADFCGVFGSRIVLHGALDRVPDEVDYTNYTINRVGEVSLNQLEEGGVNHGNYFGIYNVVNFLGALTSDVDFDKDDRQAVDSPDFPYEEGVTYHEFKEGKSNSSYRNNGSSPNMVALASGVYLELVDSLDANGAKVYGPITGVVQLDLINVQPGEGGGYVYAKNQHGEPNEIKNDTLKAHLVLSDANKGAITNKAYTYDTNETQWGWMQTSGNFVHPQKRIVDDCFPLGYVAGSNHQSQAHYWYIRGNFYVYNQYLSAYTGASVAYADSVNMPLTITASSDGYIELVSVDPSMYAYFDGKYYEDKMLTKNDSILIGSNTYYMNDPISYWDWSQLSDADKEYFVDSTYVAICDATISGTSYKSGDVLLPEAYRQLAATGFSVDENGDEHVVRTDSVMRISNEVSHKAGYLLTADMNNPHVWDEYYTAVNGDEKILNSVYDALKIANKDKLYHKAPTLKCLQSGIYGQIAYEVDDVVRYAVVEEYEAIKNDTDPDAVAAFDALTDQAGFKPAYITVKEVTFTYAGQPRHLFEGSYIAKTMYDGLSEQDKACFQPAYICIETIEEADKQYILNRELISEAKHSELAGRTADANDIYLGGVDLKDHFDVAYICTSEGMYGGSYFEEDVNYAALDYCNLPLEERSNFAFNYDALDLLVSDFNFNLTKYDHPTNERLYSAVQPIDYKASYLGTETYEYTKKELNDDGVYEGNVDTAFVAVGNSLSRDEFELILNEQSHYVALEVPNLDSTYYVVKEEFERANIYYPAGSGIEAHIYNSLTTDQKNRVTVFEKDHFSKKGTYYFCVESYLPSKLAESYKPTTGTKVALGVVLDSLTYIALPNYQRSYFGISGNTPVETSTLYVPRTSDILSLSKDRVVTAVFKYTYKEQNADGSGYEKFAEKHILNIHLKFKSGEPTIGALTPPTAVLPNSTVGLSVPTVTPGAYEVIGGGWEIYETPEDAEKHRNGTVFRNNATPMYWYQNGYLVSYYAKSYLGRTYSNPVPFTIANYHRLGEVMSHVVNGKHEYMYIDHKDVDRNSKIYLDSAAYASNSIAVDSILKNDLDFLQDLYAASLALVADSLDARLRACDNLEFILRSDIAPKSDTIWVPIGGSGSCFSGKIHGNGYTISGLRSSLFGNLCDSVYNLGVTGSFTGAGIADNGGYAENCWVYTSDKSEKGAAVIGEGGTVVNSYYRADNNFAPGAAISKTHAEFEKGEVAYLLNGFYLDKRYRNNNTDASDNNAEKYVERFYKDGDFIYANGKVVKETDERYDKESGRYIAVFPHDYIYFGQQLTYETATHDSLPVRIIKVMEDGIEQVAHNGNRIYRAPAYYLSKNIDKIHFNANAYFAERWKGMNLPARPTTAIDFTGYNDVEYTDSTTDYRPYLDYEGISFVDISDMTYNLLIYADPVNDAASYTVLDDYLYRPIFKLEGEYGLVGVQSNQSSMRGHLVDLVDGEYKATSNHFLVDGDKYNANFNVPIKYSFADGYYMWYQRTPQAYAEGDGAGWAALCLPFTADLTTTQEKGQITHFYGDSTANHEYWLRELRGMETVDAVVKANFQRPDAVPNQSLVVTNSFLYDKYYEHQDNKNDANNDKYQEYYKNEREYKGYPYIKAHTPYIVAFPGERYYEFDMSGKFQPANTGGTIGKLKAQVVTMVSVDNDTIRVTDDVLKAVAAEGYGYKGAFDNATVSGDTYVLNAKGDQFEVKKNTKMVPFRAYMTAPASLAPRRILIGNAAQEEEPVEGITERGLTIYGKKDAIYIESTLECEATVVIYGLSGQVVARVKVQPMSKEVVTVPSRGVYIANNRKVTVL